MINHSAASSNGAGPVRREPRMHYGRPHPVLLDPALLGARGEGTSESPLLLGEDEGEVYSNNTPIQLTSLTRKDKDWTAYQVRNDNNNIGDIPQSVIPVKTGIQNPIQLPVLKKE